jgi:O-antigen ligase
LKIINWQFVETWTTQLLYIAVLLLFFATYNNRAIGVKYTGYGLAMICILILLWLNPKEIRSKLKDRTLAWLVALVAINAIAILQVDPEYQLQSLEHFRKGLIQAALLAVAISLAVNSVDRLTHVGLALGFASLCITFYCIAEIIDSPIANALVNAPTSYRYYGFRYIFYFPFLWMLIQQANHWKQAAWITLVSAQLVLVAFSGFRGAWLAAIVMIALWAFFFRTRKLTVLVGAMLVLALGAAAFSSDHTFAKLNQTDTGKRWDGAWRASIDMIKNRPLFGHGFGSQVFQRENDRLADDNPDWALGKALTGPHSIYLDVAFSAGIPALLILLVIFGYIFRRIWRVIWTTRNRRLRSFAIATLCSFVGFYVVLGALESLRWELLGMFVGLAMSISNISQAVESKGATA